MTDLKKALSRAVTLPDLPRLKPTLTMLDRDACLAIHQGALHILRTTGVQVYGDEGLSLLRNAGADVGEDGKVRFSASLVEWALASAPDRFALYGRDIAQSPLNVDGTEVYFGTGSDTLYYLDPRSHERRRYTLADLKDIYTLVDALPELGFLMSVGVPADVPAQYAYRNQFAQMLRYCTKPMMGVADDPAELAAMHRMASALRGGDSAFARYPLFGMYTEPSSPLLHSREATEKLLLCAQHGIPVTHSPAPMMGGTAPITLAGAATLGNAEILSGLVMHQLKTPGAPFLYGHGVHHLDMRDMVSVYGAPEFQLARVMAAEMARFYQLPVWGYAGHSDSKQPDAQAAADARFSVMVALQARTNINHDVGYLESGLASSPELMVLCNEIIAETRRFTEGVRVDAESLALDVIDDIGPGGDYLGSDHTMDHWREFWMPSLFDRRMYDAWVGGGSETLTDRVQALTVKVMDSHTVDALPAAVEAEIAAVLAEADDG